MDIEFNEASVVELNYIDLNDPFYCEGAVYIKITNAHDLKLSDDDECACYNVKSGKFEIFKNTELVTPLVQTQTAVFESA